MDGENRTMWVFEPHAAEQIFEDYVKEFGLAVFREERLDRNSKTIVKKSGTIASFKTISGHM